MITIMGGLTCHHTNPDGHSKAASKKEKGATDSRWFHKRIISKTPITNKRNQSVKKKYTLVKEKEIL